jgi:transposase
MIGVTEEEVACGTTTCDPGGQGTRIVLSVLSGEVSIAEAARKEKVSEQSIGRWKAEFLEAGRTLWSLVGPGPPPGRSNWKPRSPS